MSTSPNHSSNRMVYPRLLGLAAGLSASVVALATPVQAATFSPFNFTTNFTLSAGPDVEKKSVLLNSVTAPSGTVSSFIDIATATITNQTGIANGPGSTEAGDLVALATAELPSNDQVKFVLADNDLNTLIDTEDDLGKSVVELILAEAADSFYFWERGQNSDLLVEALSDDGATVLASSKLTATDFGPFAGFSIDTKEIDGAQKVGAIGLKLDGVTAKRIRLTSDLGDNGPDFNIKASKGSIAKVSEPFTLAGLVIVGSTLLIKQRRPQAGE